MQVHSCLILMEHTFEHLQPEGLYVGDLTVQAG